jgi:hypothetical protein
MGFILPQMTTSPVANANPAALAAPDEATPALGLLVAPDPGMSLRGRAMPTLRQAQGTGALVILSDFGGLIPASIFALLPCMALAGPPAVAVAVAARGLRRVF